MQDGALEKLFHLRENGTTVKTEIMAGITTFMTMAYILAVNPSILSVTGMDKGAVLTVTALASCFATLLMAAFANYPFALSAGMGLNAFFAFTVVKQMVLFILMSLTNIRQAVFNVIPLSLKRAVSVGIGLFIALIGLFNAQIIVGNPATKIALFNFKQSVLGGTFHTVGITVVLAVIGIIVTGIMVARDVKGGILWGILFTWIMGVICEITGLYIPDPKVGAFSVLPDFSAGMASFLPADPSPIFLKLDFSKVASVDFAVIVMSFLFVDFFDTLGTLMGVASKANMLEKDGTLPRIKGALMADSIGTVAGALMGTSTVTTFVESASGVSEGGRTGLTAVTTAVLFFLSLFLAPFFMAIPAFATAPALVMVGFLMVSSISQIDFGNLPEAIPAYMCIIAMPFAYSISEGISFGIISYTIVNTMTGHASRVSPLLYILAIIFIAKYVLI